MTRALRACAPGYGVHTALVWRGSRVYKVETDVPKYDVEVVRKKYQQILLNFPDIDL